MSVRPAVVLLLAGLTAMPLAAQDNAAVQAAVQAYQDLEFEAAVARAQEALSERLTFDEQVEAYEILAFAYASLDSTLQAVDAFQELILLNPDRQPDPNIVSTRITSLYALAFGQVLVVRGVAVDSTTFIAGRGNATIRFEVSRPAAITFTALGPGGDVRIDSLSAIGAGQVQWPIATPAGDPLPPGTYQIRARAASGRDSYDDAVEITVGHGEVDTVLHLVELAGYDLQPETEIPPRSFRPLGVAALYSALATGAALLVDNSGLGNIEGRQVVAINLAALAGGLIVSLKRPAPQPVEANIRYNRLVAEQLVNENRRIAQENAARRRQVVITVVPTVPR